MDVSNQMQNISELSEETLTNPGFTPGKLAIMKLRSSEFLNGLSPPPTPSADRIGRSFSVSSKSHDHGRSSSHARSTRHVSSSVHRSGGSFRHSHSGHSAHSGHKISMELTRQAEGKFFALMDLVSSASREASSLKEIWASLVSERELLTREREELLETVTEITESLELAESEHHHHGHEHEQRKLQIEKLVVELSLAMNTISEHEKRNASHDHDLSQTRNELQNLRSTLSRTTIARDKFKSDYESSELRIKIVEDERDHAKTTADKYHEDWRALTREFTDVKSKYTDTTIKLETVRREVMSITERLRNAEMDRDTHLNEKERLQELLRKANLKYEETSSGLVVMTEQHEHSLREITKFKEVIREMESDMARHTNTVENLRRELKIKTTSFNEAETRTQEILLDLEHLRRETTITKDKLSAVEQERIEQTDIINQLREECRLALVEQDSLRHEAETWKHAAGDHQRMITRLQETQRKNESSLVAVRSEVQTLTVSLTDLEHKRSSDQEHHKKDISEIASLKEKLIILQAELRTAHAGRERLHEELREFKERYEEVTETITEFRDSSGNYESEIERLNIRLREAREEKEIAITARNEADRQRDDYMARYDEKCRAMERSEHSFAHMRSESNGGGEFQRSTTRIVSRSGTMNTSGTVMHHENGNGHAHGHVHGHEHGHDHSDDHQEQLEHSGSHSSRASIEGITCSCKARPMSVIADMVQPIVIASPSPSVDVVDSKRSKGWIRKQVRKLSLSHKKQ